MPLRIFEGERRKTTFYIILSAIAITIVALIIIAVNIALGNIPSDGPSWGCALLICKSLIIQI